MASTIVTKNSSTASAVPVSGDLTQGELAVNVTDKKLYTKDSGGTVVKLVGGLGNQEANAVAITGGSVNGTTIGATTASTGAFTTLSASSTTTLSGGTANGVAYLNGSKVVTTGTALTFDGTNLGLGTASPVSYANFSYMTVNGTNGAGFRLQNTAGTTISEIYENSNGLGIFSISNLPIIFGVNNTEQMRLTSTGLGIGTSSPTGRATVTTNGSGGVNVNESTNATSTYGYLTLSHYTNGAFISTVAGSNAGADILRFGTGNTERMRLDSSGNLGLGVTPSTWSTGKAFEVGAVGNALWGYSGNIILSQNTAGYSGGFIYATTAAATRYQQNAGSHIWYNAASGTAGTAISFTQAMTLDASGNLLVGTTTAYGKISLAANTNANNDVWIRNESSGSSSACGVVLNASGNSWRMGMGSTANNSNALTWAVDVSGANSEKMRLDTSGTLYVGGGTNQTTTSLTLVTGGYVRVNKYNGVSGDEFIPFSRNGTTIGSITQSGTTAVLYNVTSDERLKENIVDAPEFGSVIDAIQVRSYDWKTDGNHQRAGFVAQELVTVAPEAVHQPADPEEMMAVDYSKLVPMLVKEIQSLRQRVAQLEGK